MYAGRIMESGPVETLLSAARHPYTDALMRSMPSIDRADGRLATIPGQPPDPSAFPEGCRFAPRCPHADNACVVADHVLVTLDEPLRGPGRHDSACIHAGRMADGTMVQR
jgi:oligopeptide/dipeptide ABC transporter ATP-binding protein